MYTGHEFPLYVQVIAVVLCLGSVFLVAAYEVVWEWFKGLVLKVHYRHLVRAGIRDVIRVAAAINRQNQQLYLEKPHTL